MASNYPPAPQKNRQTIIIAALAAVIVLMATVIIVLVMRTNRSDDAPAAQDTTAVTPSPVAKYDEHLIALYDGIFALEDALQDYIIAVPEYDAPVLVHDGEQTLSDDPDQLSNEVPELEKFEASEREMVRSLFALLQRTPKVAELMQKEDYLGASFDYNNYCSIYGKLEPTDALDVAMRDPAFFLWQKDDNGNAIILNGHPLLDLDACKEVVNAATEYRKSYTGEGSPWD